MESNGHPDEWWAPVDPIGILLLGAAVITTIGLVVKFTQQLVTEPKALLPFVFAVSVFVGCYSVGLVVYHAFQRFV